LPSFRFRVSMFCTFSRASRLLGGFPATDAVDPGARFPDGFRISIAS
jgi:hypothetical protein